jgi:carboxyl-terminal processing protease
LNVTRRAIIATLLSLILVSSTVATEEKLSPEITEAEALENFDFVWKRIRDTHFDADLNGVDWDAVRTDLRPRAAQCAHIDSLRTVIWHMLHRLEQSHFGLIPSDKYDTGDDDVIGRVFAEVPDHMAMPQPGIDVRYLDGRVIVTDVWDFGTAVEAGVEPGWELVSVASWSCDSLLAELEARVRRFGGDNWMVSKQEYMVWALIGAVLSGEEGSSVALGFRDGKGQDVSHTLERRACPWPPVAFAGMPEAPVFVKSWKTEPGPEGNQFGVIELHFIWLPGTVRAFENALAELDRVDGLVVDIRGNLGGVALAIQAIAGHLTHGEFILGTLKGRNAEALLEAYGDENIAPYAGPIALLIDEMSGSASELFAAGLKDAGRARVFGEPTAGAALPAIVSTLPNGDRLVHAVQNFIRTTGESIEGNPVHPHVLAPRTRDDLLRGADPALQAALEWLESSVY